MNGIIPTPGPGEAEPTGGGTPRPVRRPNTPGASPKQSAGKPGKSEATHDEAARLVLLAARARAQVPKADEDRLPRSWQEAALDAHGLGVTGVDAFVLERGDAEMQAAWGRAKLEAPETQEGGGRSGPPAQPPDGPGASPSRRAVPKSFANYHIEERAADGKQKTIIMAHPLAQLDEDLEEVSPGWPKRLGGTLFVEGRDLRPVYLKKPAQLIAYIGARSHVDWAKGSRCVPQEAFFEHLRMVREAFDSIELLPHTPSVPGVYYMHAPLPRPTGKFEGLIDFFLPATPIDRTLIKAMFLTPSWGGAPGTRPAHLVTGPDRDGKNGRGSGKSRMTDKLAELYLGKIEIDAKEDIGTVKTRLLSEEGATSRILRLDNVKTFKLGWAELESLITAATISGKALYRGEGQRPNLFTCCITLNGASLSEDMAQRVILIKVARPPHDGTWEGRVSAYIEAHRFEILADMAEILARPPADARCRTRWGAWELGVLSKLDGFDEAQATIVERQGDINADNDERDDFREYIEERIRAEGYSPEVACVLIANEDMAEWVCTFTRQNKTRNWASAWVSGLGIGQLTRHRDRKNRGWVWTGDSATDDEPLPLRSIPLGAY